MSTFYYLHDLKERFLARTIPFQKVGKFYHWFNSRKAALNGKTLEMIDDHTLPQLVPIQQSASQGIKLPALTFGFFVFADADAAACK